MRNRQPDTIEKKIFKNILSISFFILVFGIGSIFLVEIGMSENGNEFISTDYLEHLSNYFAPVGVILSFITVLLLYANFRHQQTEFKDLKEASILANEIQIVNNELGFLNDTLNKKKYGFDVTLDFEESLTYLLEDVEKDTKNLNLEKSDNIRYEGKIMCQAFDRWGYRLTGDIYLIFTVIRMLKDNSKLVNIYPFFYNRLPILKLLAYVSFLRKVKNYYNEHGKHDNFKEVNLQLEYLQVINNESLRFT